MQQLARVAITDDAVAHSPRPCINRRKKKLDFTYELIIVDDGSRDQTRPLGCAYSKKYGLDVVRVLPVPCNRGKGHAVKCGMMAAR